jgi:hypothetical protein
MFAERLREALPGIDPANGDRLLVVADLPTLTLHLKPLVAKLVEPRDPLQEYDWYTPDPSYPFTGPEDVAAGRRKVVLCWRDNPQEWAAKWWGANGDWAAVVRQREGRTRLVVILKQLDKETIEHGYTVGGLANTFTVRDALKALGFKRWNGTPTPAMGRREGNWIAQYGLRVQNGRHELDL